MKDIVSGKVLITSVTLKEVDVMGKKVVLPKATTFPVMRIDGTTVMSGTPQETMMMRDEAHGIHGRVLVAGLGLGVVLDELRKKKCEIVVIEPNQDVVLAYKKYKNGKVAYDHLVRGTIEEFLEKTVALPPQFHDNRFDFIHLDTWYGLDPEYLPHINWMIGKAKPWLRDGGTVRAWGYDVMVQGFVRDCLATMLTKALRAHPDNIKDLCIKLPLLGRFVTWYRAHPRATRDEGREHALSLTKTVIKCPCPLTVYLDYLEVMLCHSEGVRFKGQFDQMLKVVQGIA